MAGCDWHSWLGQFRSGRSGDADSCGEAQGFMSCTMDKLEFGLAVAHPDAGVELIRCVSLDGHSPLWEHVQVHCARRVYSQ